jgi:hypothetical protein
MHKSKITQSRLFQILIYNNETGKFRWRVKASPICKLGVDIENISREGYYRITIDGKTYMQHRLAWLYVYGVIPLEDIDHIDCDKTNNKINNLRLASCTQNARNVMKKSTNKSGHKGVHWDKCCKKWMALIRYGGKQHYLGLFDDPKIAHDAYCKAAEKVHGEFHNFGQKSAIDGPSALTAIRPNAK